MGLDILGATMLALYGIILGPLGVLRGPIVIERALWYCWVLVPQGLMARSIRAAIDWRLGHFDSAIAQLEGLVGSTEDYYRDRPHSRVRRRVLEDFYTALTRAYLHAGHIDDAMLVVIRAKKSMSIDRLPGLAELDAKTAHLVRAGLAAGRLLDGGGLATMFVKSNQPEPQPQPKTPGSQSPAGGRGGRNVGINQPRQGATTGKGRNTKSPLPPSTAVVGADATEAKIIPFPRPVPTQGRPTPSDQ
jgi:hypothetical protein